jgi:hypothetical protein
MYTLKQFIQKFEEELSMTTSAVPGAGDDNTTVVMRKKYDRKNKRDDQVNLLKRFTKTQK